MSKNAGRYYHCALARRIPAAGGNHTLVPVYRTLTADLETPVSAFLRLAADEPESFLLESVEGGEKVGRYTFIGTRPYRKILARGSSIAIPSEEEPVGAG